MSVRRLCCCPGCVRFREEGSKYCSVHREEYEAKEEQRKREWLARKYQHTQSRANDFYRSPEWRKLSRRLLNERKYCEICGETYATDVHHIFPVADFPELALNEDNLKCLCKSCHAKITEQERKMRSNRRKENG